MRVKLSKLLSAVLAICIVFVGFTAFAAGSVTIVTTYDYNEMTANPAKSAEVTATVGGLDDNKEVTFLVANKTSGIASGDIVYIDQKTVEDGVARFTFTDAWNKITAAYIKFGSDADFSQTAFKLNNTVNYWSTEATNNDSITGVAVTDADLVDGAVNAEGCSSYAFIGKVTGQVKEYGIDITLGGKSYRLPAMGCDAAGNFVIVIDNLTAAEAVATAYGITE